MAPHTRTAKTAGAKGGSGSYGSEDRIPATALKAARMCAWEWDLVAGDVNMQIMRPR